MYDLIVRAGTIVDGTGAAPFLGDVGITNGKIVAVGKLHGGASEEIDASNCIVTPGFVDVHTHYDGQAIWSSHMSPSSHHGVTTVVMGNCGVGFAPCRPNDRALLLKTMEGVEDIPEIVMTEGLTWNWETFPEFMNALDDRPRDVDVAMLLPHCALRVYAMGERGANREPASREELKKMADLTREAMEAGAIGFGTSRILLNRRSDGEHVASFGASEDELRVIASAMGGADKGIFQLVPDMDQTNEEMSEQIAMLGRVSAAAKVPVTFTLGQVGNRPDQWRDILGFVGDANRQPDIRLRPQIFPRPFGMIIGHSISATPFSLCPSYLSISHLPLEQRIVELRKPEIRAKIISEDPTDPLQPLTLMARSFSQTYKLSDPVNYEPDPATSIMALAASRGIEPAALAYDLLLENDGQAMLYVALANYAYGSLDFVPEMLRHPDTVVGLGDGGAHYGLICDASYPTFMLTHWVRDRAHGRIPIAEAIQALTSKPAELMGLLDRGKVLPGYKADINVIEHSSLKLHAPTACNDLPAGGRRLDQRATGYRRTIVSGQSILDHDVFTGRLPGSLVRGMRSVPACSELEFLDA